MLFRAKGRASIHTLGMQRKPPRTLGVIGLCSVLLCSVRHALAEETPHAAATAAPSASPPPTPARKKLPPLTVDYNASADVRGAGNYLWPVVGVVGINLVSWGIPYAAGSAFVQVEPSMWAANFRTGPQWDDGEFEINQLGHPYMGALYFSAARSNGLTFWESAPYTFVGSWMWEYFLEHEQPSTNDFLTTTLGGTFLGEALYRLSNAILDDSTSGSERLLRELGALAVNPMNGIERLLSGRTWASGPSGKPTPLLVNLRLGVDGLGLSEGTGWGTTFRTRVRFEYGDPYAASKLTTPFEVFHLALHVGASKSILGQGLDGTGVLLGHRFSTGQTQKNLLAWVMSFRYSTNGTRKVRTRESAGVYQLGEIGTGPSWFARFGLGAGFSVHSELDALAVPSGAVTSPYAKFEANRSYNYGLGGALNLELSLRHERLGRVYARGEQHLYHVVDGARGTDRVGGFEIGAYANLWRGHGLGANAIRYDRRSYYDDYPDVRDAFWSGAAHYEFEF